MDASTHVAKEFDRLLKLGSAKRCKLTEAQQAIWYIVLTRCEADINGFRSVFEQGLAGDEVQLLVAILKKLDEPELAKLFDRAYRRLCNDCFYPDRDWEVVSLTGQREIESIEDELGNQLWYLDDKLAALLR